MVVVDWWWAGLVGASIKENPTCAFSRLVYVNLLLTPNFPGLLGSGITEYLWILNEAENEDEVEDFAHNVL